MDVGKQKRLTMSEVKLIGKKRSRYGLTVARSYRSPEVQASENQQVLAMLPSVTGACCQMCTEVCTKRRQTN